MDRQRESERAGRDCDDGLQKALTVILAAYRGEKSEIIYRDATECFDSLMDIAFGVDEAGGFSLRRGVDFKYLMDGANFVISMMHFNSGSNYYVTLGLPAKASQDEIKERWKRLMLLYHPDRHTGNSEWSEERAKKVNEAYGVLKNASARSAFDRKLARYERSQAAGAREARTLAVSRQTGRGRRFSGKGQVLRRYLPAAIVVLYIVIAIVFIVSIRIRNRTNSIESELRQAGDTVAYNSISAVARSSAGEKVRTGKDMSSGGNLYEARLPDSGRVPLLPHPSTYRLNGAKKQVVSSRAPERVTPLHTAVGGADLVSRQAAVPQEYDLVRSVSTKAVRRSVLTKTMKEGAAVLTRDEVRDFLGRYAELYRSGRLSEFMELFSGNAEENGKANYSMIRDSYRVTFSSKIEQYRLKIRRIRIEGDTAYVRGVYSVVWRLASGRRSMSRSGRISWVLAKEGNDLKITEADYDY